MSEYGESVCVSVASVPVGHRCLVRSNRYKISAVIECQSKRKRDRLTCMTGRGDPLHIGSKS